MVDLQVNNTEIEDERVSQKFDVFFKHLSHLVLFFVVCCTVLLIGVLRGLGYPHGMTTPSPGIYQTESPQNAE